MATNLVKNPGFETGDFTNWSVTGTGVNVANIGVDGYSADVHTGSFGVYAGNATQTSLTQTIATVVGGSYTVSFWLDVYQADATNGLMTAKFGTTQFTTLTEPVETDQFQQYSAKIFATSTSTPLVFTFNDPPGYFGFDDVSVTQNVACYCSGTLILTERGDVPVETLAIGDRVITLDGTAQPIHWIGRRSYTRRLLTAGPHVRPVVIRAGALGAGLPRRDLRVSPDHAMYLGQALVPAHALINGNTIVRDTTSQSVDYIHVELADHSIIFAEGAPSETFLDDDSRCLFHNGQDYARLYPPSPSAPAYYARRVVCGFELDAIRASHDSAGPASRAARPVLEAI